MEIEKFTLKIGFRIELKNVWRLSISTRERDSLNFPLHKISINKTAECACYLLSIFLDANSKNATSNMVNNHQSEVIKFALAHCLSLPRSLPPTALFVCVCAILSKIRLKLKLFSIDFFTRFCGYNICKFGIINYGIVHYRLTHLNRTHDRPQKKIEKLW